MLEVDNHAKDRPDPSTFIVSIVLTSFCTLGGMVHLLYCFVPAMVLSVLVSLTRYANTMKLLHCIRIIYIVGLPIELILLCTGFQLCTFSLKLLPREGQELHQGCY